MLVMVVWVHAHPLGTTHPPVAPMTSMDRGATRRWHAPVRRHIAWAWCRLGDQAAITTMALVVTLMLMVVGCVVLLVVGVGRKGWSIVPNPLALVAPADAASRG